MTIEMHLGQICGPGGTHYACSCGELFFGFPAYQNHLRAERRFFIPPLWRLGPGEVPPLAFPTGHDCLARVSEYAACECGLRFDSYPTYEEHLLAVATAQEIAEGIPL